MSSQRTLWRQRSALGAVALLAALGSATASASASTECTLRLSVELTPDVPDPHAPGFLSSLVGNHPGYQLVWVGQDRATGVLLDLTGPGPGNQCREVIRTMRKDGRILSIRTDSEKL